MWRRWECLWKTPTCLPRGPLVLPRNAGQRILRLHSSFFFKPESSQASGHAIHLTFETQHFDHPCLRLACHIRSIRTNRDFFQHCQGIREFRALRLLQDLGKRSLGRQLVASSLAWSGQLAGSRAVQQLVHHFGRRWSHTAKTWKDFAKWKSVQC